MKQVLKVVTCVLLTVNVVGCAVFGQMGGETAKIIYYAPAWGPNTNGEEVVYFLKQVTLETAATEENRIYLCSIKPDGSERKEIARLWKDRPEQFLEPYSTAATMEVNAATKRAAIGVEKGQMSGVFIVNLDGKEFRSLWPQEWNQDRPTRAGYPTWSPDGQWLAFHEFRKEKGFRLYRIVKCRPDGADYKPLTERQAANMEPAWSPNGDQIAYTENRDVCLWLMKPDGSEKRNTKAWGRYSRWSPDGQQILHDGDSVVDAVMGKLVRIWKPTLHAYPKWGKSGYAFVDAGQLGLTKPDGITTQPLLKNAMRRAKPADLEKEDVRW